MTDLSNNYYPSIPACKTIQPAKICDKCNYPIVEVDFNSHPLRFNHEDMCAFYVFRDIEAPKRGLTECKVPHDQRYWVSLTLETMGIECESFWVYGVMGRELEVYCNESMAGMLDLFFKREGFAGMSLEEYIVAVNQ